MFLRRIDIQYLFPGKQLSEFLLHNILFNGYIEERCAIACVLSQNWELHKTKSIRLSFQ